MARMVARCGVGNAERAASAPRHQADVSVSPALADVDAGGGPGLRAA
jgi:hypothetical protein